MRRIILRNHTFVPMGSNQIRSTYPPRLPSIFFHSSRSQFFSMRLVHTAYRMNSKLISSKKALFSISGIICSLVLGVNLYNSEGAETEFRILSLDGGGIRGILTLYILKEIEYRTQKKIIELFNFFAGTSSGGIIALGLSKQQSYINNKILEEELKISQKEAEILYEVLKSVQIINENGDIQPGDFKEKLSQLPAKYQQWLKFENEIIEILKNKVFYREKSQFKTEDLLDLYKNQGEKIFSPPEISILEWLSNRIIPSVIFVIGYNAAKTWSCAAWTIFSLFLILPNLKVILEVIKIKEKSMNKSLWWFGLNLFVTYALIGIIEYIFTGQVSLFGDRPKPLSWLGHIGNSAHSLILLFLQACSDGLLLYKNDIHQILHGPKYSITSLEKLLVEYFGNASLDKTMGSVLITSYNVEKNVPKFFLSWDKNFKQTKMDDGEIKIWRVARATSAAPLYFEPMAIEDCSFIDGGMYANDPSEIAYLTAKEREKISYLLSIGTGKYPASLRDKKPFTSGAVSEIFRLINIFMNTIGIEQRLAILNKLISPEGVITRIQIPLSQEINLDDISKKSIDILENSAKDYISSQEGDEIIEKTCEDVMEKTYGKKGKEEYAQRKKIGDHKFFWQDSEKVNQKNYNHTLKPVFS